MSNSISGPAAMRKLDGLIADRREDLRRVIVLAEEAAAEAAEVRASQVDIYQALAQIRMDVLRETDDVTRLDRAHRTALDLLDEHDEAAAGEAAALAEAGRALEALETARGDLHDKHIAALDAYEAKVEAVRGTLENDPDYRAVLSAHEAAMSMADRAQEKIAVAKADRAEKGAPFEADPLFSYLWARGYRTPAYKARPFFRTLDQWVAKLCRYDAHYQNYDRLLQLPTRLQEHADGIADKAAVAKAALEAAEDAALGAPDVEALRLEAEKLFGEILSTDQLISQAEQDHREAADRHDGLIDASAGPAAAARQVLEDGLRRARFPDLRTLAAETVSTEDDDLVDELVSLRQQEILVAQDEDRFVDRPLREKRRLAVVEEVRRALKAARLDSPDVTFQRRRYDEAMAMAMVGEADAEDIVRVLRRGAKRRDSRRYDGFGGDRRRSTLRVPDLVGELAWEVGKAAMREVIRESTRSATRGRSYHSGSTLLSRRRRRTPAPRSRAPRGGGGFRSGGGF